MPYISSSAMIFHLLSKITPFCANRLPRRFTCHSSPKPMANSVVTFEDAPNRDGILSIEFAAPGERARKVISRSNMRPTGRFPSLRLNRMVVWESPHELNAFRLLDCNAAGTFTEQPCVIYYRLGGENFRHYPDILVKTKPVNALWEIKTDKDARKPEVRARTRLLTAELPAHGYEYAVVLAEDLAREPRLHNVRLLLRHGRVPLSFEQKEYVRRLFCATNSLRWQDVIEGRHAPFNMPQACRLVLDNVLHLTLDEHFGPATLLSRVSATPQFGGRNE